MAIWSTNAQKIKGLPDDEFYTPDIIWEDIKKYIPTDKLIWEAFGNNPALDSYKWMKKHSDIEPICCKGDFFKEENEGWAVDNIIITNPPFSIMKNIFIKLKEAERPFILVMPPQKLYTRYFNDIWGDELENICILNTHKRHDFYAFNTTKKDIKVPHQKSRVKNPDYKEGTKMNKTIPKILTIKPGERFYKGGPPICYMCYKMPFMKEMNKDKGVMTMKFL
tara:strand:+ start:666 stop:1331 length:666 start_codon:yes stop_codon:yes gene_type:complete